MSTPAPAGALGLVFFFFLAFFWSAAAGPDWYRLR
jgi:hypothetical protein